MCQLTPSAAQGKTLAVIVNFVFYFAHTSYPVYQPILKGCLQSTTRMQPPPPHIFCYSPSPTPPIFSKAKPWFSLIRWLQELLPGLPASLLASIYPTLYRTHKVSPQKLAWTPFSLKVKAKSLERSKKHHLYPRTSLVDFLHTPLLPHWPPPDSCPHLTLAMRSPTAIPSTMTTHPQLDLHISLLHLFSP